jgi:hypothetical protein
MTDVTRHLALALALLPWPLPAEAEVEPMRTVDVLSCEATACRCIAEGSEPCAEVSCQCAEAPSSWQAAPLAPVQRPRPIAEPPSPQAPPEPSPPQEVGALQLPEGLNRPVPHAGFTTSRRVAARFEFGFPFLELEISIKTHDVVHLALGYRSLYFSHHGGFAALRLRLYRNDASTQGLSLLVLGGVGSGRVEDLDDFSGFSRFYGEIALGYSGRRRIHAFDLLGGVRLGKDRINWSACSIDSVTCDVDYFLPTVFLDLGYSVRLTPNLSYFLGFGVNVYTTGEYYKALPWFRNGFVVEF